MSNFSRVLLHHKNKISQIYIPKNNKHLGIDIIGDNGLNNNSGYLDKIIAHSNGRVVDVRNNIKGFKAWSYGNYVKIKHDNGMYTLYAHLEYGSVHVHVGDNVIQGEIIGNMGNTGNSYGAHLHFELRNKDDIKVDPTPYINADLPSIANDKLDNIKDLTDNELLILVKKTIRGDFGNGETRRKKLGKNWDKIQRQVELNYKYKTTRWDNVKLYD